MEWSGWCGRAEMMCRVAVFCGDGQDGNGLIQGRDAHEDSVHDCLSRRLGVHSWSVTMRVFRLTLLSAFAVSLPPNAIAVEVASDGRICTGVGS